LEKLYDIYLYNQVLSVFLYNWRNISYTIPHFSLCISSYNIGQSHQYMVEHLLYMRILQRLNRGTGYLYPLF
jgi:hypothetical protein